MQLRVGEQIGPYTLTHPLGEGGIAQVWGARHDALGVPVALKVLRTGSPSQQSRLLREGRVQAGMSHPNILPVRDVIDIDGLPGLVLPLVEGPSLRQLLRHAPPTVPQAAALLRGIVDGVRHAHGLGLVHRDLKPENVLLELRWGQIIPRVCDFGLVKELAGADAMTATGAMMGTLNYLAPEQLRDAAHVDHRADIFSLGVMMVELLTGHRPFGAGSFYALLQAYQQPPVLDGLPAPWVPLAQAMLAPEPADRLASCAALADWLAAQPLDDDVLSADGPLAQRAREAHDTDAASRASATFSAVSSLRGPAHNLPPEADAFIGRDAALARLAAMVAGGAGLITILATGGVGKTRLAQRFARAQLASCPGGAWFCDLSAVQTREGIIYALSRVLSVPVNQTRPAQALGRALAHHGRCVIILDNVEQIVEPVAALLRAWRALAPEALIIVTSRAVLGVPGEQLLTLEPLSPAAARALFLARVRALEPGFAPRDDDEDAAISALMELLDQIPLAIELAAARARIMRPRRMCDRMGQRFRLLAGQQRSLQATIDWSWDLLTDGERATLAQCSLFEGGFTLEAAEEVVDLSAIAGGPWVLDTVQSLVDKSLLRTLRGDDALRLDTFLSIRAYAAEKLVSPGAFPGAGPALAAGGRRRHAAHYLARLPAAEAVLRESLALLALEASNLSAACQRAVADGDAEVAVRAFLMLSELARAQGPLAAGVALGEAVLASPALSRLQRVRAQRVLALLCYKSGHAEDAAARWGEALAGARAEGDARLIAQACLDMSELLIHRADHDQARLLITEALSIAQRLDMPRLVALATYNLGRIEAAPEEALRLLQQGLALAQRLRAPLLEQTIQIALGDWHRRRAQLDDAWRAFDAALALAQALGQQHAEGIALVNLGTIHQRRGRLDEARGCYQAALDTARRVGSQRSIAVNLHNLASIYLQRGEPARAVPLLREALPAAGGSNAVNVVIASHNALGTLAARRGALAEARGHFEAALASTRAEKLAVRSLLKLAALALREGALDEARRLSARGAAIVDDAGIVAGQLAFLDLQVQIERAAGADAAAARLQAEVQRLAATLAPTHAAQVFAANARMLGASAP